MKDPYSEHHESLGVRTVRAHQFFSMVAMVIAISLFLVYVALSLYQSSGTLQLDLSRPGFDNARKEAIKDTEVFKGFSSDGKIDASTLSEFDRLYRQKAAEALIDDPSVNFSGDALSDAALTLDRD